MKSSVHIGAKKGAVAKNAIITGDPLRAKYIAETFLKHATPYTEVRNALGYTGTYKDMEVSVQGTGMGMASTGIYLHELFDYYGVQRVVRVGTCGSFQENVRVNEIILAQAACSDANFNIKRFQGNNFAPIPDAELFLKAISTINTEGSNFGKVHIGNILSTEEFYNIEQAQAIAWKQWAAYGVLGVEMESAEFFTIAAHKKRQALTILTVSDNLAVEEEQLTSQQRERGTGKMVTIALETLLKAA